MLTPKRIVKESKTSFVSVGGLDGLPCEDISGKITPTLLKNFESSDWKGVLSDVLKCLGDNKKQMRECTLITLDLWVAAVHLDKMITYIVAALLEPKLGAEGRKDLFEWLSKISQLMCEKHQKHVAVKL